MLGKNPIILVINPGSTSTKVALYQEGKLQHERTIDHDMDVLAAFKTINDQLPYREQLIRDYLAEIKVQPQDLSAIASRGGVVGELESGAYRIDAKFAEASYNSPAPHPANLAPIIAYRIASDAGIPAFAYDLVCGCGKPDPVYTFSGIPQIKRPFLTHVLNSRAVCIAYAQASGQKLEESSYIVAHMGGGITTNLIVNGKIKDIVGDDEGTFSPERSGGVPCRKLVNLCYSGEYSKQELQKLLKGKGGLLAYLGTNDLRTAEQMAGSGDMNAAVVLEAMALQLSKDIASLSAVTCGHVDAVILTGGMAYSKWLTNEISRRVSHIAPVSVIPGTFEMIALAQGVERVLCGQENAHHL